MKNQKMNYFPTLLLILLIQTVAFSQEKPPLPQGEIDEINFVEKQRKKKRKALAETQTKIEQAQIIKADSSDCIAYNDRDRECEVRVQDFNRLAMGNTFRKLDTILSRPQIKKIAERRKSLILKQLLNQEFLKYQTESIKNKNTAPPPKDLNPFEKCGLSDKVIKKKYNEIYNSDSTGKANLSIRLISSSDSLHIHKISEKLSLIKNEKSSSKKELKKAISKLPWLHYKGKDLPLTITRIADSLPVGTWTSPIRMSFGYVIINFYQEAYLGEPTYQEVKSYLCAMEQFKLTKRERNKREVMTYSYYVNHPEEFYASDSLELNVWLKPPQLKSLKRKKGKDKFDTTGYQSMRLDDNNLPTEVAEFVRGEVEQYPKRKWISAFHLPYGNWYFQVLTVKRSKDMVPFEVVKKDIAQKLFNPKKQSEVERAIEYVDSKKESKSFEYYRKQFMKSLEPTDKEYNGFIQEINTDSIIATKKLKNIENAKGLLSYLYVKSKLNQLFEKWVRDNISLEYVEL